MLCYRYRDICPHTLALLTLEARSFGYLSISLKRTERDFRSLWSDCPRTGDISLGIHPYQKYTHYVISKINVLKEYPRVDTVMKTYFS